MWELLDKTRGKEKGEEELKEGVGWERHVEVVRRVAIFRLAWMESCF